MTNRQPTPILLLKSPTAQPDPYETHLRSHNFAPSFLPVLSHNFVPEPLKALKDLVISHAFVSSPPQYSGLIFTSQRAVAAISHILSSLPSLRSSYFNDSNPLYTVGPASARALAELNLPCPILGAETGNADALASFILADVRGRYPDATTESPPPPLLFLAGEVRRDVVPTTLRAEGYRVEELVVYGTGVRDEFQDELEAELRRMDSDESGTPWVVVFSPSGGRVVLESAGSAGLKRGSEGKRRTRIATIGPTTRSYLVKEFGFDPDVCAEKPSPEGLLDGIMKFMRTEDED